MTEQLRVSIVAAPLAAIDPRALSQAWYSALHLARESRAPLAGAKRVAGCVRGRPAAAPTLATSKSIAAKPAFAVARTG
ncbi:MAG TPA: hypothetical protein VGF18_06830, partial [Candidatus Tumulicola sp.]